MLSTRLRTFCLSTALCLLCQSAFAVDAEAISIQADRMHLDIESGTSTYTGNVRLQRGSIVLTGDRIIIDNSNHQTNIELFGAPARYTQTTADQTTTAESRNMVFESSSNILTMKRAARLDHDNQVIERDLIKFDTVKKVLLAGGAHSDGNGQRVNIILNPDQSTAP